MTIVRLPGRQFVASFDVDAQNTFTPVCPEELPVPEGDLITPELNAQAQFAGFRVGSKDAHSREAVWIATEDHPPFSSLDFPQANIAWPVHAVPGTLGFQLIEGLPPVTDYDYFVWKGVELDLHPYGACYHDLDEKISTGVIEFLRSCGITTVIVGGLATDYCVKATVLQLLQAQFTVVVNLAACRGVDPETTAAALLEMKQAGAVFVENAGGVMS